jgi:hypothetical protein
MPGWYIVWGTGLGSGAHGAVLANQFLPFALTFVVWWIVLGWWGWMRSTNDRGGALPDTQ